MVAFSRDKILEQANLAIMAQANLANESVLKLL
jgi:flagellin-like hook-associated protein FlgL